MKKRNCETTKVRNNESMKQQKYEITKMRTKKVRNNESAYGMKHINPINKSHT